MSRFHLEALLVNEGNGGRLKKSMCGPILALIRSSTVSTWTMLADCFAIICEQSAVEHLSLLLVEAILHESWRDCDSIQSTYECLSMLHKTI